MDALTFLGTACGLPMVDRTHTSLLLEAGGRRWLLDAGEPCSHRLKVLDVKFSSLDAVFISHGHSDHISGLPMLIQGAWLEGRSRPLPVYLPGELIGPLRAWLEAVYLPEKLIGFPIEFHAWETLPGRAVELDGGQLRLSVHPTTHLDGLRTLIDPAAADRFLAYSMVLEWPGAGKRLVYSADLGLPQDLEAALTQPTDLLVCEMSHFEPPELFAYLQGKPIGRLLLTHLTARFGAQTEEICRTGAEMIPALAEVRAMRDGDRVEF